MNSIEFSKKLSAKGRYDIIVCGGEKIWQSAACPKMRFDKKFFYELCEYLPSAGVNTVVLDLADGMIYDSHPELAIEGSLTKCEMREMISHLRNLGLDIIPKLNFSTCHDVWLKDYSRMISTPIYYQVCRDVIEEVAEVFKPNHFHLGMDEENIQNQRNQMISIVRQHELWWHDFYYLVECVERVGARPWIWADYFWSHPEECIEKMPKSVVMCGWYYWKCFGEEIKNSKELQTMLAGFERLSKLGYDKKIIERVSYLVAHHHTYNEIDDVDYQILVEADFLVNIHSL